MPNTTDQTVPLIRDYRQALKEIEALHARRTSYAESVKRKIHSLTYDEFGPKILELEAQRDRAIRIATESKEMHHAEVELEISKLSPTVQRVERLLKLIRTVDEGLDQLSEIAVEHIRHGARTPIDPLYTVRADTFKKVVAYIVPTGKPTNCFALVLMTRSIFNSDILREVSHSYISSISHTGCSMYICKEGPSRDKLMAWSDKHGVPQEVMTWLDEHERLEQDYELARGLYLETKWLRLYLQRMVRYYEQEFSRGTETHEYRVICDRLKALGD